MDFRQSQNKQMIVKGIIGSITKTIRQKISNQDSVIIVDTPPVRSGNLVLRIITNKTIINIRTISAAFRAYLRNIDSFMSSCNSNIKK